MNTRRQLLRAGLATGGFAALAPRFPRAQVPGQLAAPEAAPHPTEPSFGDRMSGDLSPAHDPCIIREDDTYYVFGSDALGAERDLHMPWKTSRDLLNWTDRGNLHKGLPKWATEAVPGTKAMWAPDVSFVNDRFHIYYAVSTFGGNQSAIGLFTSPTLNPEKPGYAWRDEGLVIMSHPTDDYNCIDPCHVIEPNGDRWLAFGSFWGGVKLVRLDKVTGRPSTTDRTVYGLAQRQRPVGAPDAIEAPFIFRREGFYYLFASYDYCCKGVNSSYYMVVGRSPHVVGPYVGRDGRPMMEGIGTLLVRGDMRWRGPGHNAVLHDAGRDYLVYHTYDAARAGASTLRISPITWTADGWPTARL